MYVWTHNIANWSHFLASFFYLIWKLLIFIITIKSSVANHFLQILIFDFMQTYNNKKKRILQRTAEKYVSHVKKPSASKSYGKWFSADFYLSTNNAEHKKARHSPNHAFLQRQLNIRYGVNYDLRQLSIRHWIHGRRRYQFQQQKCMWEFFVFFVCFCVRFFFVSRYISTGCHLFSQIYGVVWT